MPAFVGWIVVAFAAPPAGPEPDVDRVLRHLKSDEYTVTWGAVRPVDSGAALEVGYGSGHGFTLRWLRFRPAGDHVEVVSIHYNAGRQPYRSKWPPDRAPVAVQSARMKPSEYAALLRDLAIVEAANLRPPPPKPGSTFSVTTSTHDFWVHVRLTGGGRVLVDSDWAGYEGSLHELTYAKPRAGVALAREAIARLTFEDHHLTAEERSWASAKFARDWARVKGRDFYWWVRERYIVTVGAVGDTTAIPTLREILGGDPKDRCVYHAINAVTRLTGQDVRDKPVEEMDVVGTRDRVLTMLRDFK